MPVTCKRGLCWPVENTDPVFTFTKPGSKISWLYNWSPNPTPNAASLSFVTMQWNHINIEHLASHVTTTGSTTVLGFNEPELPDQSNLSPEFAAVKWMEWIEPLRRKGVRCGSPAISSAGHAVGWLQDFVRRIRLQGSDVDFWCLHWYGETLGQFYDYIWST